MFAQFANPMFAVWLALALTLTPLASAQPPADDSAADPDPAALFARGKELYGEGKYEESYRAYLRAFELQPTFDVAGNLGNVEIELGKHVAAIVHLDYALNNLPLSFDADKRKAVMARIRARRSEAIAHVATVRIVTIPAGAEVSIGDASKGRTPTAPFYLEPGKHQISASLAGYAPVSQLLEAEPGGSHKLTMTLEADDAEPAAPSPPPPTEQPDDGDGPSVPLLVVGSLVAAAGVGVGVALLVVSESSFSDAEDMVTELGGSSSCSSPLAPAERCAEIESVADDAVLLRGGGIAALVVGGAALGATMAYGLWPRGDDEAVGMATPRIVPLIAKPGSPALTLSGALLTVELAL